MAIDDTLDPINGLSIEEKAGLTSGKDFWNTKSAGSVPSVMVTDGPHGLRKQRLGADHLGLGDSVPATCFPPAVGLGSSFDTELARRVGVALGVETQIEDVAVLLGPGVNIKRSPLCGRNFEYFSEDPIVAGIMGAALVTGIQSQGVGTSLKHFAANNQETDRLRVSSDIDERTLREIYLRAFQRVVQDAQPWTVMCSYNRINGVYASENPWLLTQVLREEWGFEGLVVSDWGAVSDRVAGLIAGLDLEMPSSDGRTDAEIVVAVREGRLDETILDTAARRVANLAQRAANATKITRTLDVDAHHSLAREAAQRSIVLLKNDGALLPLGRDVRIAVLGEFAQNPRYQGAGSSLINPTRLDKAIDYIRKYSDSEVTFAPAFSLEAEPDAADVTRLRSEAVDAARDAEIAVVFLGLPARLESEGFDRTDIDLPADQLDLLDAVLEVNPRTVVVLSNGGVVALPFADRVPAILEGWLLGQAGGGATADVLFGAASPSAKLTETVPLRLQDNPSFGNFPGGFGHVRYGEGQYVGYRWYDTREMDVAFPFGHGLTYTTFSYENPTASATAGGSISVKVTVRNTGDRAGREIVQVYTALPASVVERPVRELKAFALVDLEVGESREVDLTVRRDDLAYWDIRLGRWVVEGGEYRIDIAASSRDVRAEVNLVLQGDQVTFPVTGESSLGEVLEAPGGPAALRALAKAVPGSILVSDDPEMRMMMSSFPVNRLGMLGVDPEHLDSFLKDANTLS